MTDRDRFAAAHLLLDGRDLPPAAMFMVRLEEQNLREDAARGLDALAALWFRENADETDLPVDLVVFYEGFADWLGVTSELLDACLDGEEDS